MTPLAIDLFCGLGGWTEGLLAEGYRVVGFDLERHHYGEAKYPAQLVLQDVLTIHGSQFKTADLIVASPPCQEYSYMAMPWSRAKQLEADYVSGVRDVKQLTALFDACFRIQREACEAANAATGRCEAFTTCRRAAITRGHFGKKVCGPCSEFGWKEYGPVQESNYRYIPLVVENVRGAQKWVGKSRWNFGSFHLWGDVPALMPMTWKAIKGHGGAWFKDADTADGKYGTGNFRIGVDGMKGAGDGWFNDAKRKGGTETGRLSQSGSKSPARKAASAMIAKIPFVLSSWIARAYFPHELAHQVPGRRIV